MNSPGASLVARILHLQLYIVLWSAGFAAALCPDGQYLDQSSSCVECTSCLDPNNFVITPCNDRNDTVCGSITDVLSTRIKEKQLPWKNENQKKPITTEDGNTFFETYDSYNIMLGGPKNKSKKNNDAVTFYDGTEVRPRKAFVGLYELTPPKSFDKNGKHIKKDLSSVDDNQTSKPNVIAKKLLPRKKLSKPKKTEDESLGEDDKLAGIASVGSHKIKKEMKPFYSDEDEDDISRLDENVSDDEDADDIEYSSDDEDEDDEEEEGNSSEGDEDLFDPPFVSDKVETSEKPFGVDGILLTNVHDDDYTEVTIARNKYGVNVEPYIGTTNWQLLILVSAASACFLFMVVVSTYLCLYMKRWRHQKQGFEAGVEDLSVRINLMQHASFEADESNNCLK